MNKQEFSSWAKALRTYYPREQLLPNEAAMELWYQALKDIPMQVAEATLRKWVATNKWSPTIAEIRENAVDVKHGEALDWSDAWERVQHAIRRYGNYRAAEAMASLDPITRATVKRLGFYNLCVSENPMSDRKQFRDTFEVMAKREQMRMQLPLELQDNIRSIQAEFKLMIESGEAQHG